MINKRAKGNIIIKTEQLPYSILWDSLDPAVLDTYVLFNQELQTRAITVCFRNKSRPISLHMHKNFPLFTDLCLKHLLSLEAPDFVSLPMKTLSIFAVIGINVTISYSNDVACLLVRRTRSTQQHTRGMEGTQCSHKRIQLMSCPKLKQLLTMRKSSKFTKISNYIFQFCETAISSK